MNTRVNALFGVNGVLDDGWRLDFPVKGTEIESTVLFADISGFSTRTIGSTGGTGPETA